MTQKDYERHIQKLHDELINAWNAEERVKALKIAIQVLHISELLKPSRAPNY
jgi:hypothetical protein